MLSSHLSIAICAVGTGVGEDAAAVVGKRVLVVNDGPTLRHGDLA
jgi:predicted GTPase